MRVVLWIVAGFTAALAMGGGSTLFASGADNDWWVVTDMLLPFAVGSIVLVSVLLSGEVLFPQLRRPNDGRWAPRDESARRRPPPPLNVDARPR